MVNNQNTVEFIGRAERVSIPEFGIKGIKAKVDTGAYSVAIDANNIRVESDELIFCFLDLTHPKFTNQEIRTKLFTMTKVKSSNGDVENRYVINTTISIGGRRFNVEATLANRSGMKYPILIGRKFLSDNKFVVDVTSKYMHMIRKKNNDRLH